jgi:hypothetical protein
VDVTLVGRGDGKRSGNETLPADQQVIAVGVRGTSRRKQGDSQGWSSSAAEARVVEGACDAIMAVRVPPAARKLRELVHFAQIVRSHALSFFYLSAPDFLLGMDSDPAARMFLA